MQVILLSVGLKGNILCGQRIYNGHGDCFAYSWAGMVIYKISQFSCCAEIGDGSREKLENIGKVTEQGEIGNEG